MRYPRHGQQCGCVDLDELFGGIEVAMPVLVICGFLEVTVKMSAINTGVLGGQ
jgi:hypothetical protein